MFLTGPRIHWSEFKEAKCIWTPTLEGAGRLLSQSKVLLRQVVDGLVLVDLHTGAHVALAVQEEGKGAG